MIYYSIYIIIKIRDYTDTYFVYFWIIYMQFDSYSPQVWNSISDYAFAWSINWSCLQVTITLSAGQ